VGCGRRSGTLHVVTPLDQLRAAIADAAIVLGQQATAEEPFVATLERPKRPEFGDYSTNAAMLLAPKLKKPPREIAVALGEQLEQRLGESLKSFEVAGPGFLNIFLADHWHRDTLAYVLDQGEGFGGGSASGAPERILVEFVSANPTGPLTAAGGRHAAYGDALARMLSFAGHDVQREYYINDHGSQIAKLGASIVARSRGEDVPEGGYEGAYVSELALQLVDATDPEPDSDALAEQGVAIIVDGIRETLHGFRVDFDTWFSERSLHQDENGGAISAAYKALEAGGATYASDDATWLRTTAYGDDKDRVLRRSNGEDTYFASDIAYHLDKRARGFQRLIDVWGADHHGYVARMKAAFTALGDDPDALEIVIMQFVNIIEHGERASMSKRRGDFITLSDLISEIGVDAARFLMLQRSHDSTVDLDLDLAREQSSENPVYYVQYAHARIVSVLTKADVARVGEATALLPLPAVAVEPAERALIHKLLSFSSEVDDAVTRRAPHRIAAYALELAQEFTAFYRDCQIVGVQPVETESFRLGLAEASRRVIACALGLLAVDAPDVM